MANVIRTQFNGFDGRLNIEKGILTLYGKNKTERYNVTVTLDLPVVREFLNTAFKAGKSPTKKLLHNTKLNTFIWADDQLGSYVQRFNRNTGTLVNLQPGTEHTKDILQAMVRANVK
jgi:hypothetical protein